MPKISVIIPAYNAMAYLPKTLSSVLQQTYKNFEVVIINDGSTDEIESWFVSVVDPRVSIYSQSNQGLAAARNSGIAQAQGDYLAFLDADDLWEPTKLEKQVRILEENPEVGLVYTWVTYIDENGQPTGRVFKNQEEGDVWKKLTEHNIVECGSVAMVRRSCLDTVGVFDQNLTSFNVNEDWDMWLRIAARYPFKAVKEPLVYYRQHSNSASRNWEAMEQSFNIVIEKAFASAPQELLNLKQRSYAFANLCLAWRPLQSRTKDHKKATHFCQKALAHYPKIRFSKEYMRLSLAIAIIRWFGSDGYKKFLAIFHALRRYKVAIGR